MTDEAKTHVNKILCEVAFVDNKTAAAKIIYKATLQMEEKSRIAVVLRYREGVNIVTKTYVKLNPYEYKAHRFKEGVLVDEEFAATFDTDGSPLMDENDFVQTFERQELDGYIPISAAVI